MEFKCGIIGLPNVGKSTLFNALTKSNIAASNFPFCTINQNRGIAEVPDQRLPKLAEIVQPNRIIPATIEFVDIAGLVKNASKGEGLGNLFLKNIREMEAICHVVRCFEDDTVTHMNEKINPEEDIRIINTELILYDLDICEHAIRRIAKKANSDDKNAQAELAVLKKCILHLEKSNSLHSIHLSKDEINLIRYLHFLTIKPTMYIANTNQNSIENNTYLYQIRTFAEKKGFIVVPICASFESIITKLDDQKYKKYIQNLGIEELGINRIIRTGYSLLNLQSFFTIGKKEIRAWTIPIKSTALKAASKIHTDIKKGFIRAQVISYEDFIFYRGQKEAKKAGKIHIEGQNYIVKDGDIINFLFKV